MASAAPPHVKYTEEELLLQSHYAAQRKVTIARPRRVNGAPSGVMAMGSGPEQSDPGWQAEVELLPQFVAEPALQTAWADIRKGAT